MAVGIIELLTNRELRNSYSRKSLNIVKDQYYLEHHIAAIEAVYNEVLISKK